MQRAARIPIAGVHSPVYHVSDTSSTLDLAATLLVDTTTPTPHLTTIIADRQSAGRGRLGRTWTTPDGQALLASTIVSLAGAHARAPRILRQGVLALADLERVAGVDLSERTADATHDRTEVDA